MNIRELETFELLAQHKNMTRVAEVLSKTVMAISKQITNLENHTGHPLFIRTTRELKLTEFGNQFLVRCREINRQHRELEQWLKSNDEQISGEIKVLTQSNDVIIETIAPWLADFLDTYPGLSVELDVKESLVDIKQDDYDIYWGIGPYLGQSFGGLKQRFLYKERYGVFASKDYLKRKGNPTNPDELHGHEVIGYLYNQPSNVLVLQNENKEPLYKLLNARVKTVAGMVELAQSGLGLVNLAASARQVKKAVAEGSLTPVMESYWWEKAEVFVYYHQTYSAQAKVRAFLDYFLEKRPDWV